MAVLVDAMIFLVVLTVLSAVIHDPSSDHDTDGRAELLRSYHAVMLSGQLPDEENSSLFAATLSDYLIALSLCGGPNQNQVMLIEKMVNGTITELGSEGCVWLVIEISTMELRFGSEPPEIEGVFADRRELGDGSVVSTLYLA